MDNKLINILVDFNIITENDKYHNVFVIKERDDNFNFIEDLEIHYIELPKFKSKDVDTLNDIEAWITFLKECSPTGDTKVVSELTSRKEEFNRAMAIMEQLSANEIEYQRYLQREKYLMDEISRKKYAERKKKELEDIKLELESNKKELETNKLELETKDKELERQKNNLKNAVLNLMKNGYDESKALSILNITKEEIN